MRTNRPRRWLLLCVWIVTAPALAQERVSQQDIGSFFNSFTDEWVRRDPDLATATRYFSGAEQDRLEQQLTPNTRAWDRERIALARRGLSELAKFDAAQLSDSDRLSAQLMHWMLDGVVRGEKFMDYRFPLEQFGGANVDLVETLTLRHPVATEKDASNYVKRLAQVGTRMDEALVEGRRIAGEGLIPPAFIIKTTLASMRTFRETPPEQNPLVTVLTQKMATVEGMRPEARAKLQAEATRLVGAEVYPAWDRAIQLLESIQPKATDDAGLWRYKGGADAYAYFLNRFTTTDYTPEQIHQIGLKQVASIEGQMDAVLKKLGRTQGTVRERIEKLRQDLRYPDPASDAARAAIMRDTNGYIEDALKRSQSLFDMQPKTKVIAQPFPRFREQSAAANYNRAPLDGSRPAIFQIPLRDARMTRFGLRSLVYHETVPGHHFQIALEQENTSLPRFRQARVLGGISALSEGWALYAEKLVAENGWYEGDPEGLLGMLDAQLFRARRLVVDTGLHAKHWTRQRAIDYGLEPSEVERYVVNPGQACAYMIGQLRLLELRDKARDTLGTKFKPQAFHDVVLKTGTAPLDMIATEVDRYIRATSGKNP
jgi:uncharacterized protein (DUF885 family)